MLSIPRYLRTTKKFWKIVVAHLVFNHADFRLFEDICVICVEINSLNIMTNFYWCFKHVWIIFSFLVALLGNGLATSEGATHAMHKRLMSPAFNNHSISSMLKSQCSHELILSQYSRNHIYSYSPTHMPIIITIYFENINSLPRKWDVYPRVHIQPSVTLHRG